MLASRTATLTLPRTFAAAAAAAEAPAQFDVEFETTKGNVTMKVERDLAPIGVDHFYDLVQAGHFDNVAFFRMAKGFVVQFGLSSDPAVTKARMAETIKDDPVKASNAPGTVTYAKSMAPDSRSTQLFINLGDNSFLDSQGFAPFATIDAAGMDVVSQLYDGYGEAPDQGAIMQFGEEYLKSTFPDLDYVVKARVVEPADE
ncbi:peptidyl-prolyl cis-trans isomerase [Thecamonas trahens ATCC 50062]|uniref:peptidylprolyl isomerase n=1 Tax=Thecamonas trahens ATCC 50062 TaxID=461836 RepID=A0A0L0DEG6_THETB|nr:peptidyl-prolyl cis-trans isomerase [Thecamonas trahens ATCC 50062]KNC50590.1 peptidyl-prolyl cis-trans isomerase [Thecamonas trahens ATCC 50062]|eukprot:XP_013762477.1 peptidyl-prolyl cis-trans isomerase [Thecamonas trahens ATCC 50062]